jgi:hypothetical protein
MDLPIAFQYYPISPESNNPVAIGYNIELNWILEQDYDQYHRRYTVRDTAR